MIVKNVITIILVVITGTAFVRCAAAAGKHRPKLKKGGIGHKPNDDVLHALSDFGVVRRSLNPMLFQQYSNVQYLKDERSIPNTENRKNMVIEKLELSVTFRDNILYIFSYLLHGLESGLTEEQYTSLQTLYECLKKKMVYMYNLLPILSKLDTSDKNQQTSIILLSLTKNLPSYIQCTAKYLANEIEMNRIDLNALLKPTEYETFNYLANIDLDTVSKGKIKNEETTGSDKYSNITQKALGPVFVKLIYNLQAKKLPLSQELFGLILMNLPNPSDDPVLEENIRFLYDLTKINAIDNKDWDSIGKEPVGNDAYTLVFSALTKVLSSNVQMIIKDAAAYVYHHLKVVTVPSYVNSNFKYMRHLTEKDIDIGMLLSAVIPQNFDSDAVRMKNSLLTYFMHNYRNEDMNKILKGFNKFAYSDPLDLLMAFLTRLTNRVPIFPNTNSRMLQQPAAALLSALIMKKYSRIFTPFVSPEVDVLILLESLNTPDVDSVFQSTVDSIKLELIAQPQISVLLSTLIPTEKDKCTIPKQCLMDTFQQVQRLQNNIPLTLTTKIQNVAYMLRTTSHPQRQPQNFPTQYSIKPVDVNLYLDREKPVSVAIETDSTYTNNVPSGFNGVPYVWNIDKYVSKVGPAVQDELQVETFEYDLGVPTYIESADAKVVSVYESARPTTTNQVPKAQITEAKVTEAKVSEASVTEAHVTDVPAREYTTQRPLTMRPSLTSVPNIPSVITQTPTQRPRKKQPVYTTKESVVEEYNSEVEHTPEHISSELIFQEKEVAHQPSTSEEFQTETSSLKEVTKTVTTKQSTEVTKAAQQAKPKLPQTVEEKTSNENVSSAIVLPPIETNQPLKVQLSTSGVPVVTTSHDYNATESGIILPDVKDLLKSPEINDFMRDTDSPIAIQVLQPLSVIFGKNYIKRILKKNVDVYPTNIALLSAILKEAATYPEVIKNTRLINVIHKYIASIEYVSPTILLPIVVSSKKLVSTVVYSTFNPNDLTDSTIGERPPDEPLSDSVTVPLVNPKLLLQSISPSNPYADLLPIVEEEDSLVITIQPLKMMLTSTKMVEILGPDFQPLAYPNKGALLITVLHKLQKSKVIQSNPKLKFLVDIYIKAIEVPSMSIQVSEDKLVKMMSETTGQWLPELTSLISVLPTAKNDAEVAMTGQLEQFLGDPTLLEKLHIDKPPLTMSRGDLLRKIILSALSGTIRFEKRLLKALRYYKKVELTEMGALPIMWMWVETYVVKAEVQLGDMIQETVNFDQLTYKEKLAYNDVITYLAQNPNLLQDNEDFDFEKYKTQGQFIKGLFKHLLKMPQVNSKIKKNIQIILPRVSLTGSGSIAMPSLSGL
ncbi:PREDICTED: uncharacterized protein LOC105564948 [Vollenhovia emeryi]|uniref:uncharacterized protein LOC105564948 n=1 Tax=Vollenhovia emeryi TaxID=411798 RepID=UPI0005F3FB80|nr:PREDICTED: uncharacterized protein LOC105564948 [Vollenhovia emeryi]